MTRPSGTEATILEALIESELAASETYRLAVATLGARKGTGDLRRIEGEHRQAAGVLRERCRRAAPGASPWARWVSAARPGPEAPGDDGAALGALKAGEEDEIREYEAALENPSLGDESKRLIASLLLPQTRMHLLMLERYARK